MTIKNLRYGSWLPHDESSDTPSDRKGGYQEKSDHLSSNYGLLYENEHRKKALDELEKQQQKLAEARDETANWSAKADLFMTLNYRNNSIPHGAVVILKKVTNNSCKVAYQGHEYTTKLLFLRKIWKP